MARLSTAEVPVRKRVVTSAARQGLFLADADMNKTASAARPKF